MLIRKILERRIISSLMHPRVVLASHTATCPTNKKGGEGGPPKRAEHSGKCRLGFIPEEWFTFFHPKTGVSGPYVFGIVLANYWVSKEILVMEHEYYSGLSWLVIVYVVTTKFGPGVGAHLDKEVDAVQEDWERGRKMEKKYYEDIIKEAKTAQWRAQGQSLLTEAKKENVTMQLEAAYRERCMYVFNSVKGRMDYHVKRHYAEVRIHQRWMIDWILQSVMKSVTEDFEKRALDQAIADLSAAASRA